MAEERLKGQGSTTTLRGLAQTLSIFVDRAEHRWTRDEKLDRLGQCRVAEGWLQDVLCAGGRNVHGPIHSP